ncbi:MAG: hypothetical protein KDB88_00920 [Flavobacteriales bacterium]|nr:hypothetical protein [Flavobacteriales bacterium]
MAGSLLASAICGQANIAELIIEPPADVTDGGRFGNAVALSGDHLLVGAPRTDDVAPGSGAVYLFERNEGGANQWGLIKKLEAPGLSPGAELGTFMLMHEDMCLVSAPYDRNAGIPSGAIYVFGKDAGGTNNWGFVQRLFLPGLVGGSRFGTHFSIGPEHLGLPPDPVSGQLKNNIQRSLLVVGIPGHAPVTSGLNVTSGGIAVFYSSTGVPWCFERLTRHGPTGMGTRPVLTLREIWDSRPEQSGTIHAFELDTIERMPYNTPYSAWDLDFLQSLPAFGEVLDGFRLAGFSVGRGSVAVGNGPSGFQTLVLSAKLGQVIPLDQLGPPDASINAEDHYGNSFAADDQYLFIGAPGGTNAEQGFLKCFSWSGQPIPWPSTLTPTTGEPGDRFAYALAVDQGRLAVGAPRHGALDRGLMRIYSDLTTDLAERAEPDRIDIYPNPCHGGLHIRSDRSLNSLLRVTAFDVQGKAVSRMDLFGNTGTLSLPEAGLFHVRIENELGEPVLVRSVVNLGAHQ